MRFYHPTFREVGLTQGKARQPNLFFGMYDDPSREVRTRSRLFR